MSNNTQGTAMHQSHARPQDIDVSVADGRALVLRTTNVDGTAYGGFQWPIEVCATVTAPDWRADDGCGGGLHGLLDGWGDYDLVGGVDALWWLVEVDRAECRDLGGKVKFPSCAVRAYGSMAVILSAIGRYQIAMLIAATSGRNDSGDYAQIGSSGYSARIGSSGDYARIGSSGDSARIGSSGYSAWIGSSGDSAQIGSSGDSAQIGSSGDSAWIEATGSNAVVASAAAGATVTMGDGGACAIAYHDGTRTRFAVGYVGECLTAGVRYRVNDSGEFEAVE